MKKCAMLNSLGLSSSIPKFRKNYRPSKLKSQMNNTFNLQVTFPSLAAKQSSNFLSRQTSNSVQTNTTIQSIYVNSNPTHPFFAVNFVVVFQRYVVLLLSLTCTMEHFFKTSEVIKKNAQKLYGYE